MKFEVTEEKVKEVANRYGLTAKKMDNKDESGFIIDGKQVDADELFDLLFQSNIPYNLKKLKDEYKHWKKVIKNSKGQTYSLAEDIELISFANGFVAAVDKTGVLNDDSPN